MKDGSSRDHEFLVSRARGQVKSVRDCIPNTTYVSAAVQPELASGIHTTARLTHVIIYCFEHLLGRNDQRGHLPYCNLLAVLTR